SRYVRLFSLTRLPGPRCPSSFPPRRSSDLASRQGALVHVVSGEVMAELAQTVTPRGILAVCRFVDVPLPALASAGNGTSTNRQTARMPRGVTVCASSAMTSPLTTCTRAPWRLARSEERRGGKEDGQRGPGRRVRENRRT